MVAADDIRHMAHLLIRSSLSDMASVVEVDTGTVLRWLESGCQCYGAD